MNALIDTVAALPPDLSRPGRAVPVAAALRDTAAAPTCRSTVTYGLFADHVQQTRNNANCPTTVGIGRPLISSLSNGTTPLFTYYDDQGNLLSSGQATAKTIKVTVVVTYTGGKGPLTLTSTLALRNARWEPS
jgi:hypothetical protein